MADEEKKEERAPAPPPPPPEDDKKDEQSAAAAAAAIFAGLAVIDQSNDDGFDPVDTARNDFDENGNARRGINPENKGAIGRSPRDIAEHIDSAKLSLIQKNDVTRTMSALASVESGHNKTAHLNYGAVGPTIQRGRYAGDRALGAYQVMGRNVPSWAKQAREAGVLSDSNYKLLADSNFNAQTFLSHPEIQDAIVYTQTAKNIYRAGGRGGPLTEGMVKDVASIWFTGTTLDKARGRTDGISTTESYTNMVAGHYNKLKNDPRYAANAHQSNVPEVANKGDIGALRTEASHAAAPQPGAKSSKPDAKVADATKGAKLGAVGPKAGAAANMPAHDLTA